MSPSKIKLAVFDLDGTIVDAFSDIAAAANYALEQMGYAAFQPDYIQKGVGNGVRNLMRYCLNDAVDEKTLDQATENFVNYYKKHNAELAYPYPGAVESLYDLQSRKIKTAVVSNKLEELTVGALKKLQMHHLFDAIIGETDRFPRKPDPAVLNHLISSFSTSPSETIVIGDGPADIEVARNADCVFIGVTTGLLNRAQMMKQGVAYIIDSLYELPEVIEQIAD